MPVAAAPDNGIQLQVVQVGDQLVVAHDDFYTFGQKIGRGGVSGAQKADMSTPPIPSWTDNGYQWAYWGDNDRLPTTMREKIEASPIGGATVAKKISLLEGNGLVYFKTSDLAKGTKVERAYLPEVEDWMEENRIQTEWFPAQCADYCLHMNSFSEAILSIDRRKVTGLYHISAEHARLSKANAANQVDWLLYSYHFPYGTAQADPNRVAIPLYKWYDRERFMSGLIGRKFAWHTRFPTPGMIYYARPFWLGLFKEGGWLDISGNVPKIVDAMQKNQVALKYVINIPETFFEIRHPDWSNYAFEKRKAIIEKKVEDINKYLAGVDNTGKSLVTLVKENFQNGVQSGKIEVVAVDDKLKTGAWVPDSTAADAQIVQGFGIDPSQIGLTQEGGKMGAGSGSDKREAYNLMITLNTPDQRRILERMNWISKYNGWGVTFMVDHTHHTTTNDQETGIQPGNQTTQVKPKSDNPNPPAQ